MRALAVTARGCCTLERPALNVFSVIWKTEPSLRDFSVSGDHTIGSFEDIPADCPVLFGFLGHPAIYTSGTPYWPRRTGVYGTGQLDAAGRILGRIYLVAKALSVKGLRFTRFAQASGIEYFKGRDRRMEVDIKAMGMPIVGVRCNRTVQLRIPSIRRRLSVYSKGHLIMAETMPELPNTLLDLGLTPAKHLLLSCKIDMLAPCNARHVNGFAERNAYNPLDVCGSCAVEHGAKKPKTVRVVFLTCMREGNRKSDPFLNFARFVDCLDQLCGGILLGWPALSISRALVSAV